MGCCVGTPLPEPRDAPPAPGFNGVCVHTEAQSVRVEAQQVVQWRGRKVVSDIQPVLDALAKAGASGLSPVVCGMNSSGLVKSAKTNAFGLSESEEVTLVLNRVSTVPLEFAAYPVDVPRLERHIPAVLYTALNEASANGFTACFIYDAPDMQHSGIHDSDFAGTSTSYLICRRPVGSPVAVPAAIPIELSYTRSLVNYARDVSIVCEQLEPTLTQYMTANQHRVVTSWQGSSASDMHAGSKLTLFFEPTPESYAYTVVDAIYSYQSTHVVLDYLKAVELYEAHGWELATVLEFVGNAHPQKFGWQYALVKLIFQAPTNGRKVIAAPPVSDSAASPIAMQVGSADSATSAAAPCSSFNVQVPPGAVPGSGFVAQLPDGQTIQVQAPLGVVPGQMVTVQMP